MDHGFLWLVQEPSSLQCFGKLLNDALTPSCFDGLVRGDAVSMVLYRRHSYLDTKAHWLNQTHSCPTPHSAVLERFTSCCLCFFSVIKSKSIEFSSSPCCPCLLLCLKIGERNRKEALLQVRLPSSGHFLWKYRNSFRRNVMKSFKAQRNSSSLSHLHVIIYGWISISSLANRYKRLS